MTGFIPLPTRRSHPGVGGRALFAGLLLLILWLGLAGSLLAGNDRVLKIRLQGLNRVEEAAVRAVLRLKVGDELTLDKVQTDIRAIYAMGYFSDVQVDRQDTPQGVIVTYVVEERPSIKEIQVEGNDKVDKDDILEVVDIKPFSILNHDKIQRNVEKIKNVYVEKGYYLADVEYELRPAEQNQVTLVFKINEHAKIEVKKIVLLGNEKISDADIREVMLTKPGDIFSFITSSGQFRSEMLERDVYMIANLYAERGYINAKVATPIVSISPDRTYLTVTISITEGDQFFMGDVDFKGDLLFPRDRLRETMTLRKGEIFNRTQFIMDLERLAALYKDEGYAYANATPESSINEDTRQIDLVIDIRKGKKVWIEQILITGNARTRDKVIRREMRIAEGDLYSISAIRRSKMEIYRLGYFETVEITESPGSNDEKILLTVEVKERRTGTFQLGFGFSSIDSFVFQSQVSEVNFLGRGQTLSLMALFSGRRRQFMFHFFEPYLADTRLNFGFSLFNSSISYPAYGEFGGYSRSYSGFDLTLGYPVADNFYLFMTYSLKDTDLQVDNLVHLHLFKSGLNSNLALEARYDSRDNRMFPSSGMLNRFTVEYADGWLGSDIEYSKFILNAQIFYPVFWKVVFKLNVEAGYVLSLEEPYANKRGPKDFPGVPISERFLLGGIFSLRGFEYGSISPTIKVIPQDDPAGYPVKYLVGGNKEFFANFEFEFPVIEQAGLRWVFFYDIGNTWNDEEQFFYLGQSGRDPYNLPLGMYMSWGFGFRWYSPMGPLRFEWGLPITKRPEDEDITFEFSIGNQF